MKIIKVALIWLSVACVALTSCKQDDTLRYNNITMGDIKNGTFISDQGNIFNVVEKTCEGNLEEMKRAFVACDVLRLKPGTENEYDIRLNAVANVLVKDAIKRNIADEDDEAAVSDPVYINAFWISGGYLNMQIIFEKKEGSDKKHLVNLVMEENEEDGKYVFTLRHNAFGESFTYEPNDGDKIMLALAYVSFPLTDIIDMSSAEITFNWKWYQDSVPSATSETLVYSHTISYTKSGYEQTPANISSKVTGSIN